jgi:hypothetical protein
MRTFTRFLTTAIVLAVIVPALRAQALVTAADLTRLETTAGEIETLASTLSKTDPTQAADVRASLKDATEEISYLKVKLRREGRVTREEYAALRDKLETLRVKAQGSQGSKPGKVTGQPVAGDEKPTAVVVPVGTQFDVRLQTPLNSGKAQVEQRFEGTTLTDVEVGERVAIPSGSIAQGFVSSVRPAGRIDRKGSITLSFDEIRVDERTYRLRATVVQALDPKMSDDVTRIGAGAVVGGIVGGILGGGKGALLGVLIGGGGTIAATEGSDADLPLGTVLRIRVDQPLEIIR